MDQVRVLGGHIWRKETEAVRDNNYQRGVGQNLSKVLMERRVSPDFFPIVAICLLDVWTNLHQQLLKYGPMQLNVFLAL